MEGGGRPMIDGLPALLDGVLTAADDALDPAAGRVLVAPGAEVAWDACCEGSGQLWVRVVSVTDAGAVQPVRVLADGTRCALPGWVVTVGVGVLRCSPVVDDRGRAPSADALTENASQLLADMDALAGVIVCAGLQGWSDLLWTPLGPEGGCAGGEWTFDVRLPSCPCEEGPDG